MPANKRKPNQMLRIFVLLSLVIHVFIFLHMARIYENSAMSYIELTMHQFSKPDIRKIPTPRQRQKIEPVQAVKTLKPKTAAVPKLQIDPVKMQKVDRSFEQVNMPDLPDNINISGLNIPRLAAAQPPAETAPVQEQVEFTTAKEYFDMLNLRIASTKKYPEAAKARQIEGRVKVEFVLQTDGTLSDIKIVKSSRHRDLDDAAVEAVKKASPFPRPPSFIFKEAVRMRVNILFELA